MANNTILDFNVIDTHNSKTIGIADSSTYDPNIAVANATLEITPPGGFNKVALPFQMGSVNTYNSNNVNITSACNFEGLTDLPDGIWLIRYSTKPNLTSFISKVWLRTTAIECRLQGALLKTLLNEDANAFVTMEKDRKFLLDIQLYIDGAISAANRANDKIAMELYNKASKMLDKFTNQKCNNCGNL